ncbi:choice-of-anchor J domain-containing protein [Prevotella nigrescens]|uniref:choice-of-anchor J domain-containing protein n=1 Tax=Prevotella nigrescens TaxID=28133 RepID=UPI00288B3B83|nr:choice-of-anchor J domain-containing protein [Prevotella nigrescens]
MKKNLIVTLLLCSMGLQAQNVKLPWTQEFTSEQALDHFTVIDANVDDQAFKFSNTAFAASCVRTQDADDWLLSPAIALKAGKTYQLSYTVSGESANATETYEVKLGTSKTVDALTKTIAAKTAAPSDFIDKQTVTELFSVDNDAEYYLGWHFNTEMQLEAGAFNIYNIALKEKLGDGVPAAVANAKVTPAPNGGHSADISFTAPTLNQAGAALSSLSKIDIFRGEELVKSFANPALGTTLSYTDSNVPNGKTTYKITPFSADGEGASVELETFVGIDIPAAVGKISFTYNEGKAHINWDKVTTGANGAYVNPADIAAARLLK